MTGMLAELAAPERPWTDIPAVGWIGGVIGIVIIWAAIRALVKKK